MFRFTEAPTPERSQVGCSARRIQAVIGDGETSVVDGVTRTVEGIKLKTDQNPSMQYPPVSLGSS